MRSPRPQHTAHRLAILAPLALVAACKGQPIAIINVDNPSVAVGAIVALVGDKSTDPNGDPLTYRWSMGIPAGSLSTLQAADQSRAWFSPDLPGAYTIQLKVADPSGESAPTTLQINAGPCGANVPALADLKANPAIPATGQVINLSATLSEEDAWVVSVGAPAQVTYRDRTVTGKVVALVPSLDQSTRRAPVEIEVPNDPKAPLLAWGFVRATLGGKGEATGLKIPPAAHRAGSQDEVVVVSQGKAKILKVSHFVEEDGSWIVRSGLTPTDKVLVSPSPDLHDGDPVDLGAKSTEAAPAGSGKAQ